MWRGEHTPLMFAFLCAERNVISNQMLSLHLWFCNLPKLKELQLACRKLAIHFENTVCFVRKGKDHV